MIKYTWNMMLTAFKCQSIEYIPWYFVNITIVNAYILYCKTSTRQTEMKCTHLDFWLEISIGLIAGFFSRNERQKAHCSLGLWQQQMKTTMKMSTLTQIRGRNVNGTVYSKWGKKLYKGVTFAMHTCVKMDAILPTVIDNIKLLINFFKLPLNLLKTFHEHILIDLTLL